MKTKTETGVAGLSREVWNRIRPGDSVVSLANRVFLVLEVDRDRPHTNRLHLRNPSGVQFWTADCKTYVRVLPAKRGWVDKVVDKFRGRK